MVFSTAPSLSWKLQDSGRRQSERHLHIQPTCPDFSDVLHEVPTLLAMVSSSDWAALLGCSKQLRHAVHSSVQAIKVTHHEDATLVVKGSWPQLGLIKLEETAWESYPPRFKALRPASSNFHLIAFLDAYLEDDRHTSAFVVRPLAKQLQLDQHIAAAFLNLQSAGWQRSISLSIYVQDLSKEVIAQMTCSDWSATKRLSLNSVADRAAVEQLVRGSWPQVRYLDLTGSLLGEDAMTALMSASWPALEELRLHCSLVHGAASALGAHSWAMLTGLSLGFTKLDSACTHSLTLMHQRLISLDLKAIGMDAAAMTQLFSVPWPQLKVLDLSGNKLASTMVEELVSVSMPKLAVLSMCSSNLRAAAVHHLARGNWPYLWCLSLCNNHLDDAAMAKLAKGRWPRLTSLSLSGSRISDYGLELLMTGPWPQLNYLVLDSTLVSKRTCALLSLASSLPDQANTFSNFNASSNFLAARSVGHNTVHRNNVWPQLTGVFFHADQQAGQHQSRAQGSRPAGKGWLKLLSFGAILATSVMGHRW